MRDYHLKKARERQPVSASNLHMCTRASSSVHTHTSSIFTYTNGLNQTTMSNTLKMLIKSGLTFPEEDGNHLLPQESIPLQREFLWSHLEGVLLTSKKMHDPSHTLYRFNLRRRENQSADRELTTPQSEAGNRKPQSDQPQGYTSKIFLLLTLYSSILHFLIYCACVCLHAMTRVWGGPRD